MVFPQSMGAFLSESFIDERIGSLDSPLEIDSGKDAIQLRQGSKAAVHVPMSISSPAPMAGPSRCLGYVYLTDS